MTEAEPHYEQLPSGLIIKLTEYEEVNVDLYMRDLIMENILLHLNPEEEAHHKVYHDDLPFWECV